MRSIAEHNTRAVRPTPCAARARVSGRVALKAQAHDEPVIDPAVLQMRGRLLQGREAMYRSIPVPEGGVWVDLGGGTGANMEPIGEDLHRLSKVYLVDLCDSLLAVARKRSDARGWRNVEAVNADATTFRLAEGCARSWGPGQGAS